MLQYDRIWYHLPSHFHSSQWSSVLMVWRLAVNATRPAVAWIGLEFCGAKITKGPWFWGWMWLVLVLAFAGTWLQTQHREFQCLFFLFFEDEAGSKTIAQILFIWGSSRKVCNSRNKQTQHETCQTMKYYIFVMLAYIFGIYGCVTLKGLTLCPSLRRPNCGTYLPVVLGIWSRLGPMHPVPAPASCGASFLTGQQLRCRDPTSGRPQWSQAEVNKYVYCSTPIHQYICNYS